MAYGARPVPQNIMSVEFKILDFMTLKQFGISIALIFLCFAIFYLLPFPPWNIVIPIFIILIGGIVIFVPFNGEPFQEFLSSYMEAMISPQRRIWHKKGIVVKSAAEKAHFYRFGNDPVPDENNQFNFPDKNTNPLNQNSNQLDKAETQFLQQQKSGQNNQPVQQNIQPNQSNHMGTNISPKTINNSVNIAQFINKNTNQPNPQTPNFNSGMPQNTMPNNPNTAQAQQTQNSIPNQSTGIPNINQTQPNTYAQTLQTQQNNIQANSVEQKSINTASLDQSQIQTTQSNTQTIKEQQIPNKKIDERDLETAVKNFVFGSVEDEKDNPVKQATITLKDKSGNNLEVIYTNIAGEFKTSYEYIADEYIINVNADGKEFNEIKIVHEPVDPVPVLIRPRNYDPNKKYNNDDEELLQKSANENGVFEGAYDASVFNLGQDYLSDINTNLEPVQNNNQIYDNFSQDQFVNNPIQNTNQVTDQPTSQFFQPSGQLPQELATTQPVSDAPPSQAKPIEASGSNIVHSAYTSQANNLFDQMTGGRIVNDYAPDQTSNPEIQLESSAQLPMASPIVNQNQPQIVQQSNAQYQPNSNRQVNQPVDYDIEIASYEEMPNANVPFETNLINLPNTINGILVAPNGYGLDNSQIRILDKDGILITSMNSDQTGRFYSYSPLPNGEYMIYVSKNNQNLVGFSVNLIGKVIPPKYISFSY